MKLKRLLFSLVCLLTFYISSAQNTTDEFYDIRIKKLLDAKQINYAITKTNNFRINLITEEGSNKRTQGILIFSKTENYQGFEIREISSNALMITKNNIKSSFLIELLNKNEKLKIGACVSTPYFKQFYLEHNHF
jgi:hypothetical protein